MIVRRAAGVHHASAGNDRLPRVGQGRASDASRCGCNTGCRDHSDCTRRPERGTRRTGTNGLDGPPTPPDWAGSAGRSRPSAPHCCGTAFIGTVSGAARSSSFQATEDHCCAHLLRHESGCTASTRVTVVRLRRGRAARLSRGPSQRCALTRTGLTGIEIARASLAALQGRQAAPNPSQIQSLATTPPGADAW